MTIKNQIPDQPYEDPVYEGSSVKKAAPDQRLHSQNKRKNKSYRVLYRTLMMLCSILLVTFLSLSMILVGKTMAGQEGNTNDPIANAEDSQHPAAMKANTGNSGNTASFTFAGVGDNLLHDPIFVYYGQDYGHRDFTPLYELTGSYIQEADLSYINFETVCAGDEFGLSGYPNFNGPLEMIDSLTASGFDWFSLSSNHSMDAGMEGLQNEVSFIEEHQPQLSATGAYRSEEESNIPVVRDVNGIKVGLASFTYDLNGYEKPEGADWLIDVYRNDDGTVNYEFMASRLDQLKAVSDVQIVSMHWGEEYQNEPNAEQREIAQFLHTQGVEVIIGSHPHVIQPAEFITSDDQSTLVYYSLGNFISAQDKSETMVGGMARFQLNYDFNTKTASFENVSFTPTVTWITPDLRTYRTTTIHEYGNEMAANHYMTSLGKPISREWVKNYTQFVMQIPEGIEIVLE